MNRPSLSIGDVVRLSKRGKSVYTQHKFLFDKMVVRDIEGDPTDGRSRVLCDYYYGGATSRAYFARKHLWNTGYNVFIKKSNPAIKSNVPEGNNNGRTHCMVCSQVTRIIQGLMQSYNVCQNTSCAMYNN